MLGLSGALAWFSSFPLDVVKSNVQGQPISSILSKTNRVRSLDVIGARWKAKGFAGFYSGLGPSVTRAFIVSSTRFSAYEFMLQLLNKWDTVK